MVHLYYGPAGSGKSSALLDTLCTLAKAGVGGQVLLVPDLVSHEMERRLCMAGGDSICRYAEVLTFSRLASRVFSQAGGVAAPSLDKAGRVLAMAQAVETLRPQLQHYGAVVTQPEYLTAFLELSAELKSYCVSPAALEGFAARTPANLAAKLRDLSLILGAYDGLCAHTGADPRDQLTRLADALEDTRWARGRHIYIDCFSFFTLQELAVLEKLIRDGDDVTIALTVEPAGGALFDTARDTARQLIRLAEQYGQKLTRTPFTGLPARSADLNLVQTSLMTSSPPQRAQAPEGSVHRFIARDGVTACQAVAHEISRLVRHGARYWDMAVTWPAGSGYETLLEATLSDWGIPVNLTVKRDILQTPVCSLLCAALDTVTGGWAREDLFAYLKTGFSGLRRDAVDRLENYAILWNLRGSRWERDFTAHPAGYGARTDSTQALAALNESRQAIVPPLVKLQKALYAAETCDQQVLALYAFLEDISLADRLQALTDQLLAGNRDQEAQEYSQLYAVVISALEQLYHVSGCLVTSPDRFSKLLRLVLTQYDVGTIPAVLDAAAANTLPGMRHRKPEYLFVLGADEGQLPAAKGSDSLLTEADRAALLELGLSLAPDAEHRLNQELLDIYMVFSSPRRGLWVYTTADEQPSFVFTRLVSLFGEAEQVNQAPPETLRDAAAAALRGDAGAQQAVSRLSGQLPALARQLEQLRTAAGYQLGQLSLEQLQGLYGQTLYLSVSRLEQWAQCRFHHFCTYGLQLAERPVAAFDAPAFGTFVHYVLEGLTRQVRELGGFSQVSGEALQSLTVQLQDQYARERLGGLEGKEARFVYLYQRSRRELTDIVRELGRELRVSDFSPAYFELTFGVRGQLPAIPVQGQRITAQVSGVVDRVDVYRQGGETWVRVVDYKTGNKAFSYAELAAGLSLQLPVYLFALERAGLGRPAGIVYFPARSGILSTDHRLTAQELDQARRKQLTRSGLVTGNAQVLAAMEHWEDKPQYLPVGVSKAGELTGSLLSGEQWQQLAAFVDGKLSAAADGIAGGAVSPNPYILGSQTACKYCPNSQICRTGPADSPARYLAACSGQEFWAKLAGQEEQHG